MRAPRVPAVAAITAILVISLYSAYTIDRVLSSNAPRIVFALGTTDRDVTYCNSQTLDLYIGLLALLTINGMSGIPTAVAIGTAGLIATGLLLPTVGMLHLRRAVNHDRQAARYGLAMQSLGLVGLLFGVVLLAVSSAVSVLIVSAVSIVTSAALALAGALLLRGHYANIGASSRRGVEYLILGTTLIFSGVGVILWSNVAHYFLLSDLGTTVFTDVGAAISA